MANRVSRFSLICDELERAIERRQIRRGKALVAQIRELFALVYGGRMG